MFGQNEIVGRKYFTTPEVGRRLLVTSMFRTLQGEGLFAGQPAFFVRLAKCNLACTFCDTYFDSGDYYEIDALEEAIEKSIVDSFGGKVPRWAQTDLGHRRRMVLVITGGEPSLQTNLTHFLLRMNRQFANIQIESNGILPIEKPWMITLVISPKCSGNPEAYKKLSAASLSIADCLKFVMCADPTSPYSEVPTWALDWHDKSGKPIFLSPMAEYLRHPKKAKKDSTNIAERSEVNERVSFWEEGLIDLKKAQANHEYVGQYALKYGLTMGMQLHLFASLT